jgi:hypothetical protein
MRVNDGMHVGAFAIEEDVHPDFGRGAHRSADLLAIEIDDTEVFDLHESLGHARWGGEDPVFVDATGDISVVGGNVAPLVDATPGFNDVEFGSMEIHGGRPVVRCQVSESRRQKAEDRVYGRCQISESDVYGDGGGSDL